MKVEVLISTMGLKPGDVSIFEKMNIQGDAIVCNQSNFEGIDENKSEYRQKIYSHVEKGVGRSRNTLLLRSSSDICILSDDDMVFLDGYVDKVKHQFDLYPEADVLIFNVVNGATKDFTKTTAINGINYTRYGAARIAFRRQSIVDNDVLFSFLFGGGTKYGSGEDTLFLKDCLRANLNIIGVNESLAEIFDNRPSSWFTGYNEKYFFDKGALFYKLGKHTFFLQALQYSIRKQKLTKGKLSTFEVFKLMTQGRQAIIRNQSYDEFFESN